MRFAWIAALAIALVVAAPAHAGHNSQVRYLDDGEFGAAGSGVLRDAFPDDPQSQTRAALSGEASLLANRFFLDEPTRMTIEGRILAGIWTDGLPAVSVPLEVVLLRVDNAGMEEIAAARVDVRPNMPAAPAIAELVGTDVWDAAQGAPRLLQAPIVADFGVMAIDLGEDHDLALAFRTANGLPIVIEYGSQQAPSFLLVPFHPADPPMLDPDPSPSPRAQDETNGTPGPALGLVVLALAAAVLARRRR